MSAIPISKFAFIVHPLEIDNIYKWQSWTKLFPKIVIKKFIKYLPSIRASTVRLQNENIALEGYFILCSLLPEQILGMKKRTVINKIINAAKRGEQLGAKIIGLGAYTSIIGDKGLKIAESIQAGITTGNSLTVAMAIEGCKKVAKERKLQLKTSRIAIVGATGSIGSACSRLLAEWASGINICAPNKKKLEELGAELLEINNGINVDFYDNPKCAVANADIIIIASSAPYKILKLADFKQRSIVCDISEPSNVALDNENKQATIYYFKGGLVLLPFDINLGLNIGLPNNTIHSCVAETIILAIENKYEDYSVGERLDKDKIKEILDLALKYNFRPLPYTPKVFN